MNNRQKLTEQYEVIRYAGDGLEEQVNILTRAEADALDVRAYDHLLASAWGKYGYRSTEGEWIEEKIDGSGLGQTSLRIIQALQLNPGVLLLPLDISVLTGNENLVDNNVLAARLTRIRSAHGENGENPRFFLSQRNGDYALKWPREFSWIWIVRIT